MDTDMTTNSRRRLIIHHHHRLLWITLLRLSVTKDRSSSQQQQQQQGCSLSSFFVFSAGMIGQSSPQQHQQQQSRSLFSLYSVFTPQDLFRISAMVVVFIVVLFVRIVSECTVMNIKLAYTYYVAN